MSAEIIPTLIIRLVEQLYGVEGIDHFQFKSIQEAVHDEQLSTLVDGVGSIQHSDRLVTLLRMEGIFREGIPSQA